MSVLLDASGGLRTLEEVKELVMLLRGSASLKSRLDQVCKASMVADGGVFSPNIAVGGGRLALGVGVLARELLFSGDAGSDTGSKLVVETLPSWRSGDFEPSR